MEYIFICIASKKIYNDTVYGVIERIDLTRIENKLARFRNNPKNVTFNELKTLLESYGFEVKNYSGGSHYSLFHTEYKIIRETEPNTIPMKKPAVLEVYVKRALNWIDKVITLREAEEEKSQDEK